MTRDELILSTLAAAKSEMSPVQVQKALFLLERKAQTLTKAPPFNFAPYDYGPFDQSIYDSLASLKQQGLVEIKDPTTKWRRYSLTPAGVERGAAALAIEPAATKYVGELVAWVQRLSFTQLVSAIYKEYPEMKANSVFRE